MEKYQPDDRQLASGLPYDAHIGELTLWRNERYSLRLKAHVAEEVYRQSPAEEIIPLRQQRGVRTYIHAKPYVLLPDIRLGVQLSPTSDPTGPIGTVSSSTWEGMRHEEVGHAQAWTYHEDRTIVLWEAYLLPRYRGPNVADDPNSYALWQGLERFLTDRFPAARQIVTTHDDPEYQTEHYQAFLRRMGYQQLNERAYGKDLADSR